MTSSAAASQTVLLVDDEPRVLRGLQRMLRGGRWAVHTTSDVTAALDLVATQPVDIVVSDFRMPRMDGVTLLERVRERRPETVRVVLSGDVDPAHLTRSTTVAHQWLTKPCEPAVLIAALERSRRLRDLLPDEDLRRRLGTLGTLPSTPALRRELQRCLAHDDASTDEIAAIVGSDVALTTTVLQLVNSAFVGLPQRVTTVTEAVTSIGLGTLRALVPADGFRPVALPDGCGDFAIEPLTAHGQTCAQLLVEQLADPATRDHAVTAALLQDSGQLALASCDPQRFASLLAASIRARTGLPDVERARQGFTHAAVGAYLLMLWGLPLEIVDAVAGHHEPVTGPPRDDLSPTAAVRAAHLAVQRYSRRAVDPTDHVCHDEIDAELRSILTPGAVERWRRQVEAIDERMRDR